MHLKSSLDFTNNLHLAAKRQEETSSDALDPGSGQISLEKGWDGLAGRVTRPDLA